MRKLFQIDHRDPAEHIAGGAANTGDDDCLVGIGMSLFGVAGHRLGGGGGGAGRCRGVAGLREGRRGKDGRSGGEQGREVARVRHGQPLTVDDIL